MMANVVDTSKSFLEKAGDSFNETVGKAVNTVSDATSKAVNTVSDATGKAVSTVSLTAEQAKHSLSNATANAVDKVTEVSTQAVDKVAEVTEKARGTLNEATTKATDIVVEKTNKAIYTVTQTAEQAKDSLAQTAAKSVDSVSAVTGKAINSITETTKQAEYSLTETFEKSKSSLEDTLQKAEQLSNTASTAMEKAVNDFINHQLDAVKLWIDAHPAIAGTIKAIFWAINHPVVSLLVIFLAIFILLQVVKLFSRILEQSLLLTLKGPLKFIQYILKFALKPLGNAVNRGIKKTEAIQDYNSVNRNYQEQMATLLTRLETIRQEENYILKEISTIVASPK